MRNQFEAVAEYPTKINIDTILGDECKPVLSASFPFQQHV